MLHSYFAKKNTHTKEKTLTTTCPSPVITTRRLALTFKRPPLADKYGGTSPLPVGDAGITWGLCHQRCQHYLHTSTPQESVSKRNHTQRGSTSTRYCITVVLTVHANSTKGTVLFKVSKLIMNPSSIIQNV